MIGALYSRENQSYKVKKAEDTLPSIFSSDFYYNLLDNASGSENTTDFYFFPVLDVVSEVDEDDQIVSTEI